MPHHPFAPDENGIGCDLCPLPEAHKTHQVPATAPGPPLPSPDDLGVRLTPTQPDTALAAALAAWPRARTARWWVLMALDTAGAKGNTDDDLAAVLDVGLNTIRPRRGELVAGGWVAAATSPTGEQVTRPSARGNPSTVWVLTPAARARMAREAAASA